MPKRPPQANAGCPVHALFLRQALFHAWAWTDVFSTIVAFICLTISTAILLSQRLQEMDRLVYICFERLILHAKCFSSLRIGLASF
jgi:hypothetical protein